MKTLKNRVVSENDMELADSIYTVLIKAFSAHPFINLGEFTLHADAFKIAISLLMLNCDDFAIRNLRFDSF